MNSVLGHQQAEELGAGEQLQEALKLASMGEVQPGKSASIKSITDSIQSSMACCLSSKASALSVSGLRRQLSNCFAEAIGYDKNERKGERVEPDAPLLLEGEDAAREVDVMESNHRITTAEWFRRVQRQGSDIGLLRNADIVLDEGLEHLDDSFITPEALLVLTPISNQPKKDYIWSESIMKPMNCKSLIVRLKASASLAEGEC